MIKFDRKTFAYSTFHLLLMVIGTIAMIEYLIIPAYKLNNELLTILTSVCVSIYIIVIFQFLKYMFWFKVEQKVKTMTREERDKVDNEPPEKEDPNYDPEKDTNFDD